MNNGPVSHSVHVLRIDLALAKESIGNLCAIAKINSSLCLKVKTR